MTSTRRLYELHTKVSIENNERNTDIILTPKIVNYFTMMNVSFLYINQYEYFNWWMFWVMDTSFALKCSVYSSRLFCISHNTEKLMFTLRKILKETFFERISKILKVDVIELNSIMILTLKYSETIPLWNRKEKQIRKHRQFMVSWKNKWFSKLIRNIASLT